MTREQIERAAKENASTHFGLINKEWWARKNGFEDGARWRINSVWHGLDEFPVPDKTVIVEYIIDGHADYVFTHLSKNINVVTDEYCFCFYIDDGEVTRWAYIDDLLPGGKEEHP